MQIKMQIWKEAICCCKCINCVWPQIFICDLIWLRPQFSQDRLTLLFDITSDRSKYLKKSVLRHSVVSKSRKEDVTIDFGD